MCFSRLDAMDALLCGCVKFPCTAAGCLGPLLIIVRLLFELNLILYLGILACLIAIKIYRNSYSNLTESFKRVKVRLISLELSQSQ